MRARHHGRTKPGAGATLTPGGPSAGRKEPVRRFGPWVLLLGIALLLSCWGLEGFLSRNREMGLGPPAGADDALWLAGHLESRDPDRRSAALAGLFCCPERSPALRELAERTAREDPSATVREAAFALLSSGLIDGECGESCALTYLSGLRDDSRQVRHGVAWSIGPALPFMAPGEHRDEVIDELMKVAAERGALGAASSSLACLGPEAARIEPELLALARRQAGRSLRLPDGRVLEALARIGVSEVSTLDWFAELSDSEDETTARDAAEALGLSCHSLDSAPAALDRTRELLSLEGTLLQHRTLMGLSDLEPPCERFVPELVALLGGHPARVSNPVLLIRALERLGTAASAAVPALEALARDGDLHAGRALETIRPVDMSSVPRLVEEMRAARDAMPRVPAPGFLPGTREWQIWELGVRALLRLEARTPEVVALLRTALADPDPPFRALAANALGELAAPSGESALELAELVCKDESDEVRDAAEAAVVRLNVRGAPVPETLELISDGEGCDALDAVLGHFTAR